MTSLILYATEDGQSRIQLRANGQTVWLTQLEMAGLFNASKQNISLHLKNIFEDGELDPAATVKDSLTVQTEGSREVRRQNPPGSGGVPAHCQFTPSELQAWTA